MENHYFNLKKGLKFELASIKNRGLERVLKSLRNKIAVSGLVLSPFGISSPLKADISTFPQGSKLTALQQNNNSFYNVESEEDWKHSPDIDKDRDVDFTDFTLFARHFGTSVGDLGYNPQADIDQDGQVGFSDFVRFVQAYGKSVSDGTVATKPASVSFDQTEADTIDYIVENTVFDDPIAVSLNKAQGIRAELIPTSEPNHVRVALRHDGTYNARDNGLSLLEMKVMKKVKTAGSSQGYTEITFFDKIDDIEVRRNDRAMQLYAQSVSGRRKKNPNAQVHIYAGPSEIKNGAIIPSFWNGPSMTEEQIAWIKEGIKERYEVTKGCFPQEPEIVVTYDPEIFSTKTEGDLVYLSTNLIAGSMGEVRNFPQWGGNIELSKIRIHPNADKRVFKHETISHPLGIDHPGKPFTPDDTISEPAISGIKHNLESYSIPADRFVYTAYYDAVRK